MDPWDFLFASIADMKPTDYKEVVGIPTVWMFPGKTKTVGKKMLKDVLAAATVSQAVTNGHLYFDYLMRLILKRNGIDPNGKKFQSFRAKLDAISQTGYFLPEEHALLLEINKLRNRFAHDVFYDILEYDPESLPPVSRFNLKVPKRKDLIPPFLTVVIQMSFMALLFRLSQDNRWLYLEDISKDGRHNQVLELTANSAAHHHVMCFEEDL